MSLFGALCDSPTNLSLSSKFTVVNGILYMGTGTLLLIWPGAVQTLFFDAEFVGRESALVQILGMAVAIIGWFYLFGGRSGGRQVVAASVFVRITLVPIVLVPLVVDGVFPHLLLTLAVLDPVLGLCAWCLLRKEPTTEALDNSAA
ncbi:MAG: hypothetical protein H8E37_03550 [Planctomycetes bacterium]|nr:hypothetical protein [Planctomycetota bacterium]